jgi:4-diphosphocytidyl-2-C-methyl-D-erythritol kinase
MAGGSADAGAALRLVARAAGIDDDAMLREIGAGLGADVAAQVRPRRYLATGAGERLTPLPPPAPYGVLVLPSHVELSAAAVYREADRQGLPRDAVALAAKLREVSTAAGDLPDELIVNDLEPAARALCPEIDEALAAARGAGAQHALVCGSGPTVIGLFADLRGARGAAARLSDRDPRPIAVAPWGATL